MWRQFQREIYQESSILLLQGFRWKPQIAAYHRPTKVHIVKATVFPQVLYRCESWTIKKEGWALKNWCIQIAVLEKTLQSPLDCKEIKPVNPKGNQPWILTGRTDIEAETPILWPPNMKKQFIGKDPDAGKDWGGEEKDEMVGWHRQLDGHEFEQTPGDGKGQRSLVFMGSQRVKQDLAIEQQWQTTGLERSTQIRSVQTWGMLTKWIYVDQGAESHHFLSSHGTLSPGTTTPPPPSAGCGRALDSIKLTWGWSAVSEGPENRVSS